MFLAVMRLIFALKTEIAPLKRNWGESRRKKRSEFRRRPFFLEITLDFGQKNALNFAGDLFLAFTEQLPQSNSRLMKIRVKFVCGWIKLQKSLPPSAKSWLRNWAAKEDRIKRKRKTEEERKKRTRWVCSFYFQQCYPSIFLQRWTWEQCWWYSAKYDGKCSTKAPKALDRTQVSDRKAAIVQNWNCQKPWLRPDYFGFQKKYHFSFTENS